ncbi:MAG: hypothetical protein JW827_08970 [Spirochaetes bacterium]|nr:hypothetical protein [Spirochaetota bacterium]
MAEKINKIHCIGCHAEVPDINEPAHEYIGASPGCWAIYTSILKKQYGEYGYPELEHRLTVDTYAVQHPGKPSKKSIQSVAVHLISLYYILEKDFTGKMSIKTIQQALHNKDKYTWLEPPDPIGKTTILDVEKAKDLKEHKIIVKEWAIDVWKAWSAHHDIIKKWADL